MIKEGIHLSHKHVIKKTHVSFIEFDDVIPAKLAIDSRYFGEGNSKGRILVFDFEYCLGCGLRLLDGRLIKTQDILEAEFERFVAQSKKGNHVSTEESTLQHTDFETLERLIQRALAFGKLKEDKTKFTGFIN
jgi:hypothetical protein